MKEYLRVRYINVCNLLSDSSAKMTTTITHTQVSRKQMIKNKQVLNLVVEHCTIALFFQIFSMVGFLKL